MERIVHRFEDSNPKQRTSSPVNQVKGLRSEPHGHFYLQDELDDKLIGVSELMLSLKKSIRTVAKSSETILITGESGTGKELIAHGVHDQSKRRSEPFVAVNCGALTESLLESELFGYVKAAFTGAITNKKGFFEAAGGGTIFLDEFAEMSLATQARLLRVLQERRIRPVGLTEGKEIPLNARVIVATNHDLKNDVACGKFRHDLYYRVNVLQIRAPALRERMDDIFRLSRHFLQKFNERNGTQISVDVGPDVLAHLKSYSWPGNVRELENIITRLATKLGEAGVISVFNILNEPEFSQTNELSRAARDVTQPPSIEINSVYGKISSVQSLGNCRCSSRRDLDHWLGLVAEANGNISEAARRLKIPRTTLQNRIICLRAKCGVTTVSAQ